MATVIASQNGIVGIREAMRILKGGGSALDAVESGVRRVESNPEDHTVGYDGYPNLLGELELDASIMDGGTLRSGAVGAMQGYRHAISVARQVMDRLPHVFLVGRGAERFAAEMGFPREELLTEATRGVWKARLLRDLGEGGVAGLADRTDLWRVVRVATDPERVLGTTNMIARDDHGNIASAVSTSGWAWKYPGRLGDSPVIGAGNYADSRYGAAGCTGMGEMAIRASTAHSIVTYLKLGHSVEEAGRMAMLDLNDLGGDFLSRMSFILMDGNGRHAAFTSGAAATYCVMTSDMPEPAQIPRLSVSIRQVWKREPRS
jgi:L-asparaginase / beta-aspartyl-peptidase